MSDPPDHGSRGRSRGRSRGALLLQPEPEAEVVPGGEPEGYGSGSSPDPDELMDTSGPSEFRAISGESEGSGSPKSSNGRGNGGSPGSNNGNGNGRGNGHSPTGSDGAPSAVVQQMAIRGFRTEQPDFLQTRPVGFNKQGTSGEAKRLVANYFELQMKQSLSLRMHLVTFEPQVDDIRVRKALVRQRRTELEPYLFDGAQFFTTRTLADDLLDQDLEVSFPNTPEQVYNIRIRFTRTCTTTEPIAFQLYNIIIKECQRLLNLDLIGRFYYDHDQTIRINQHRLEMWPGFITSMRQHEAEVLLNVDITFKVLRLDDVFELMKEIRSQNPQQFKEFCEAAIVGTIVMTKYNRKTYRVDGIDWQKRPTSTFTTTKRGVVREVTFLEYFQEKYGVSIKERGQPMLISHPKERDIRRGDTGDIVLVPELCVQTGLNETMRSNFKLMKDIANNLHMPPPDRLGQIRKFMGRIRGSPNVSAELVKWGVRFKADPVEVQGRTIPRELVIFQNGTATPNEQADWSAAFRKEKMLSCIPLLKWVMIVTNRDQQNTGNLISTMQRVATPLGYQINQPVIIRVNDGNARSFVQGVHDGMTKAKGSLDLIFVILPTTKLETYAAVKKTCAIEYGMPSQCFQAKNTMSKGLMSICTKLVIQMNAKQGGEPWSVANPLKGIMVVGFDVYHGSGRSIGAMTASVTPTLAKYFSTITSQEPGVEIGGQVGAAFERCIKAFGKANGGELPGRIMFYRDGVGEGQLNIVQRTEIEGCKLAIKNVYKTQGKPRPKFTFIVVTKRTNTRLFEMRGNRGECGNPAPGTVVDDGITCPEKYDFYLIPQGARQGTVSPISYNVLLDESGLDADKMQRFTYKLCHLYFNWSGTVSVPAPCQYAHKLAFLTGTALQRDVHERLSNLLHFL